jgi:predicted RNase H-like nuclease (RuvC/YqgF family)
MPRPQKNPELIPDPEYGEEDLLPPGPSSGSDNTAEINLKVQHVQEQLLDLKRQQEEVERQKKELEELSRKQREFDEGRREIVEKLTRGLVLLERQEFEVKRELEQIKVVRDSFAEHLGQTENLNPTEWSSEELPSELTKGLARVDQAKVIYSQSRARLAALRQGEEGEPEMMSSDLPSEYAPLAEKSFGAMVRDGFAYSLPLILVLLFLLVAYILLRH